VSAAGTTDGRRAGRIGAAEKAYFAAVGALALWVGLWGYFNPTRVDKAIPFLVPPLHARLLGAMYLSGLALMVGCLLARRWTQVSIVPLMTAVWTGGLLVVSLFHLEEFDFARTQPWVWFAAYIVYPLIAIWLTVRHRLLARAGPEPSDLPGWARRYLVAQGGVLVVLAAALLLVPSVMVDVWPWTITPLLAQIYSAPFLSYGIGSLLLGRRGTWAQVRVAASGILVFCIAVLLASIIHLELFSAEDVPDVLWFCAFALASTTLGVLAARSLVLRARIDE
jgi:hypothetical protein